MIRKITKKDKSLVANYLSLKLGVPFIEANNKISKILKSGLLSLILEAKELSGICWVENRLIADKKVKFIEIYVNNWRLAESFIQILRWNLNGEYFFSLKKHDFLNRTYNKNGIKFIRVEGDRNIYCYKFEKRTFFNLKKDDYE